jgi:hypothetical protein
MAIVYDFQENEERALECIRFGMWVCEGVLGVDSDSIGLLNGFLDYLTEKYSRRCKISSEMQNIIFLVGFKRNYISTADHWQGRAGGKGDEGKPNLFQMYMNELYSDFGQPEKEVFNGNRNKFYTFNKDRPSYDYVGVELAKLRGNLQLDEDFSPKANPESSKAKFVKPARHGSSVGSNETFNQLCENSLGLKSGFVRKSGTMEAVRKSKKLSFDDTNTPKFLNFHRQQNGVKLDKTVTEPKEETFDIRLTGGAKK